MTEHCLPLNTSRPVALQALLLVLLYSLPLLLTIRPVTDPDIWWHLREGQWIVEHRTVPVTDPFSTYGMGKRWIAYSWLFEILLYSLYWGFGLLGLVLYTAGLAFLITRALHECMALLQSDPAVACILTAGGILAIVPVLVHPRPWLLTILFFIVELCLVVVSRRTARTRPLMLLPPTFGLWASITGGYLISRLPGLLVSMDGRDPLHGDARILRSVATWGGQEDWGSDPCCWAPGS